MCSLARTRSARAQSYTDALDRIAAENIDANVSLKLTHLGLDLGDEFCTEQLRIVTRRATELRNFVRVDMEGSAYTGPNPSNRQAGPRGNRLPWGP